MVIWSYRPLSTSHRSAIVQLSGWRVCTISTRSWVRTHSSQLSVWGRKSLAKNEYHIYAYMVCIHILTIFSLLWSGKERKLLDFVAKYTCHPPINFDWKYYQNSSEFLNTTVYRNKEQIRLLATTHCHSTGHKSYLSHKSAYPSILVENIPYKQALRLK